MRIRLMLALIIFLATFQVSAAQSLPEAFDLRNVSGQNYVTSVKSQQGGTCWAHGTMSSIESNLLVNGVWAASGESGEPNLAEYHLDWWNGFNRHFNGDVNPPYTTELTVHEGGDYLVAAAYISRGDGVVRDIDGQSFSTPPEQMLDSYHIYYVRNIEWYTLTDDLSGIDAIKQAIMDHGAIGTAILALALPLINNVHYQPPDDDRPPNHAVAIIGWDDNKVTQAPLPGAWICKNSWGTGWGDGGFFWVSYYDKNAGKYPKMGAVSFYNTEPLKYDRIYSLDYHGWRNTKTDCQAVFNVFAAETELDEPEILEAVSFYTAADGVNYTVKIYGDYAAGTLSDLLTEQSGSIEFTGYHTIDLDEPIDLKAGDLFFIHLELSHGGYAYDQTSEVPLLLSAKYINQVPSSAHPGESFYLDGGVWKDLYNDDTSANFCIKGLSRVDSDYDGINNILDNCPYDHNPGQGDNDGDEIGDLCDDCPYDPYNDIDGDLICGDLDNCPFIFNPGQEDSDGDGVGDLCDNCLDKHNPDQADSDGDGAGDVCDECPYDPYNDIDNDGYCGDVDNCPDEYNPDQSDANGDGVGDVCEPHHVISTNPIRNINTVDMGTGFEIAFDNVIDDNALVHTSVAVKGAISGYHPGTTIHDFSGKIITFTPDSPLLPGEQVEITISTDMSPVHSSYSYRFFTASAAAGIQFAQPYNYLNTGTAPYGICAADVNGDGAADLVFTNSSDDNISVMHNDGNGQFGERVNYAVGDSPFSVCALDADNDGDLDLASACQSSNNTVVLINDGNGSFSYGAEYTVSRAPFSIFTSDVNGDGYTDILTACIGNSGNFGYVTVLLNDGTGTFGNRNDYLVSGQSADICTADFDGDGDFDLASADLNSNQISVFKNNRDALFSSRKLYTSGTYTYAIDAGDIDGDGDIDIFSTNGMAHSATIFYNDGEGAFNSTGTVEIGNSPCEIKAGDLNGDGDLDLVTVNRSSRTISILLNHGDGTFAGRIDLPMGTQPVSVSIADFNGDGILDIAVPDQNENQIALLINNLPTDIDDFEEILPMSFTLEQNYPNPFNPMTSIAFSLPSKSEVVLSIYNVLGQRVKELLNDNLDAGRHTIIWDGTDNGGKQVASGIYFYCIKAGKFQDSKKMILLK